MALPRETHPWRRALLMAAAAVVLSLVFLAYLDPHMARDLATRLWSCF